MLVSYWNMCGTSFLLAQSRFRLEEGKQIVKNSAWLLHSTQTFLWEKVLPLSFSRKSETEMYYVSLSDSWNRMGKINGGKNKTNCSVT